MRIQDLLGSEKGGKLALSWKVFDNPRALCVSTSYDSEFTQMTRSFIIPVVNAIELDTGPGNWYYRVGAVVGTEFEGTVDWSGIHEPVRIQSSKAVVPVPPPRITVVHKNQIQGGVRLYTGLTEQYYALVEISRDDEFKSSLTRTQYKCDRWNGYIDVGGLKEGETYALRISGFTGKWSSLPENTVESVCQGVVLKGIKALKAPVKVLGAHVRGTVDAATQQTTGRDVAVAAAEKVLIREAQNNRVQRFSSYADYMMFLQASTKYKIGV